MNVPTSYIHSNGAALTLTLYADETASRSLWFTMAAMTSLATRWRPAAHCLVTLASLDRVDTRRLLVQRLQHARGDGGDGSRSSRRDAARLSIDVSQLLRPRWAPLYLRASRGGGSVEKERERREPPLPPPGGQSGARVYPEVEADFECDGHRFSYLWPNSMLVLMERAYWQKEARELLVSANTLLGSKVMDEFIASLPRHMKEPDGDVVCLHPPPRNTLFDLHTDELRRQVDTEGFTRTFAGRELEPDSSLDDMFAGSWAPGTRAGGGGGRRTAPLRLGDLPHERAREDSYSSTVFSVTVSNHDSDQLTLYDFELDSAGFADEARPGSRRASCYSPTSVDSQSPRLRPNGGFGFGTRYQNEHENENEESGFAFGSNPSMQSLANALRESAAAPSSSLGIARKASSIRRVSAQLERPTHLSADSPLATGRKLSSYDKQSSTPRLSLTQATPVASGRNAVTDALLANRSTYAPLALHSSSGKKSEPSLAALKNEKAKAKEKEKERGAARPQCLELPASDAAALASPKPTHLSASASKKRASFRKSPLSPILMAFSKGKSKSKQPLPNG